MTGPNIREPAVPLIPVGPVEKPVPVDCPYCGWRYWLRWVHQLRKCRCGGVFHCEHDYRVKTTILDRGFPRRPPSWWTVKGLVAIMPWGEAVGGR